MIRAQFAQPDSGPARVDDNACWRPLMFGPPRDWVPDNAGV